MDSLNIKYLLCALFVGGLLFTACKGRKEVEQAQAFKLESIENALKASESNWSFYSAKAKVDISGGGINKSVDATIKMQKDSLVWMSVGLFGFEGVRIFMHQDSITIINKTDKSFSKMSWKEAGNYVGTDLNLAKTQSLLVGNLLLPIDSLYQLNQDSALYFIQRVTIGSMYKVRLDSFTKDLFYSYFRGAKTGKNLELIYDNYEVFDSLRMPMQIGLSAKDGLNRFIGDIKISSLSIDPFGMLSTRIPSTYERK